MVLVKLDTARAGVDLEAEYSQTRRTGWIEPDRPNLLVQGPPATADESQEDYS